MRNNNKAQNEIRGTWRFKARAAPEGMMMNVFSLQRRGRYAPA
jgi:hypothetical protein